ncbi:sodium/hydrogen exchanger 3 [Aspergillus niger]|uniref:Sodium/hydrogen exchanger 3 n=1 Tax=Aspergillus niger TaxID=5061 RepID=A0A505IQR2_ASPNG|nr:sodium/hydrogen exchanger 3 [Aspergillus niger]
MPSDKVEKKRKRASDRHERPSKKPALELQDLPPLASSVVEDDSELAPVIITTPGLNAPRNLRLNPYLKTRSKTSSSSSRNKGIVSSELLLQSSEHPKLDFVGREAEEDADSQLKHYVAVVDPENKTWQFIEVRKMTLRGAKTMRAQRTELTNTFGTKQSRKAAQSLAENAQLSNVPSGAASAAETAILGAMPADAATDIASKTAALQAQVQAAKPLPQANLDAAHPSEVYPLDVLVPNGLATLRQLPNIKEWQDSVNSGAAVNTTSRKRLPPREDLRRILSGGTTSENSASGEQLADPVIDAVRRKFAPQGASLSKNDITFLHTTICALSLHIPPQPSKDGGNSSAGGNAPNELATDPSDLRDDLRLDNVAITQYFRELGCRVDKPRESEFAKWGIKGGKAEAAARRVARLKIPVEFPKVSRGGGRR